MRIYNIEEMVQENIEAVKMLEKEYIEKWGRIPAGFDGVHKFNLGAIIVDDEIEKLLDKNCGFDREIAQILTRFKKDDWGEVSYQIQMGCNMESKYLGNGEGMIGIYGTPKGYVRVDTTYGNFNGKVKLCTFLTLGKKKDSVYAVNDEANCELNEKNSKIVKKYVQDLSLGKDK